MKVSAIQNNSFYQTKQVKNSRKRQNQMMQTAQPAFKSEKGVLIGAVSGFAVGTLANVLLNSPLIIAGGAVAGNTVGRLLDENVFRIYCCESCGFQWRAA